MNRSARVQGVKGFERSNGLDIALCKNIPSFPCRFVFLSMLSVAKMMSTR